MLNPAYKSDRVTVYQGDCLDIMPHLEPVDAVVTDPPYGLAFMGKKWDYSVPGVDIWRECLRLLKPGGHLLSFAGTRTQHRMAVNIEDAGFEIRDMIAWVYASGFPKSLDVSKAIDKAAGAERQAIPNPKAKQQTISVNTNAYGDYQANEMIKPNPVTDAAKQWQGWGTALKPAMEPITVARKPLSEGTVAANVLAHGTGALNIDGCRVGAGGGTKDTATGKGNKTNEVYGTYGARNTKLVEGMGRWPANLLHDGSDEVVGTFPVTAPSKAGVRNNHNQGHDGWSSGTIRSGPIYSGHEDSGSAARFFFSPKASKKDRGRDNQHPTVKPVDLISYLVRLVTPPDGLVLDPFAGSGTTGESCIKMGNRCILIEREPKYIEIIKRRLEKEEAQGRLF